MSLLVTGSIAIDSVKTPYGISENCLGGSAVYFCMAASLFGPVRLVGAIGPDCPFDLAEVFAGKDVDLTGLEIRKNSKTFRWAGTYHDDVNKRTTDRLELNVLAEDPPEVPLAYRDSKFVFLANTAPALQLQLLSQVDNPSFVAADTMDCWIQGRRDDLDRLLKKIDCLIINDDEAKMLAAENNLIKAADTILKMGPAAVVIKKGEHGSLLCSARKRFILPAFPSADVKDPTGAGDSFAGAFMGYLAKAGETDFESLKQAIACGTVVASFAIADFSLDGLTSMIKDDINGRLETLRKLTQF